MDFYDSLRILRQESENYLNEKKQQNLSKHTIKSINNALDNFYEFYTELEKANILLKNINKVILAKFITYCTNKQNSANSINLKIRLVKSFLLWLADNNLNQFKTLKLNLVGNLNLNINQVDKLPETFTPNNYKLLLRLIGEYDELDDKYVRFSAIIKLLLFTGIRSEELINIKFSDIIELEEIYQITIHGKGGVERQVFISRDNFELNFDYLKSWYGNKSEYLIATLRAQEFKRMSHANLFTLIENHLREYGINQFGIHIFRHTFAVDCLQNKGFDLAQVQFLLGHKSIMITNKYYARYDNRIKINAAKAFKIN